ncbi:hypothetical protein [Amycolatopsis sp. cmx-11-51]|uniref:hypothetical protein n=1 Tax=unclassified Amycolatopsis TaxID=2618356 RepID=UPI0039E6BAC2
MRNELGLHPVPDLPPGGQDSPEQETIRRKAALVVASRATSAGDYATLLDMLGLHDGWPQLRSGLSQRASCDPLRAAAGGAAGPDGPTPVRRAVMGGT